MERGLGARGWGLGPNHGDQGLAIPPQPPSPVFTRLNVGGATLSNGYGGDTAPRR